MPDYAIFHEKPECFYSDYERKGELHRQTHYCPGCGHGITHKLLAEAIDELGIRERVILISPVGCSVFAYYYFDVGNIQVAHGRAAAAAVGVKRARPDAIVISYQGDGDLAAIGIAEVVHAANRGDNYTTIFVNNAIYGMTGGQMAPTTLIGQKSTTSPFGREKFNDGLPLKMSELLGSLESTSYIERVSLGSPKTIMQARKGIQKALRAQMEGKGFSLVEVLSPCPTIWKLDPVDAQKHVHNTLDQVFPLGVKADRTTTLEPHPARPAPPPLEDLPRILRLAAGPAAAPLTPHGHVDWRIRVAGFGGQGVLLLGQILAEAGMDDGLEVSWLPSYGPEMRSGTSNCHVRISSKTIDSPLVSHPNVLLALNEPSLRKFIATVQPGGYVLYNGAALPEDCRRLDITAVARQFVEEADALGSAKAGNVVMLGALLELARCLPGERVDGALRRVVRSEKFLDLDRRALIRGRQLVEQEVLDHA